MTSPQQPPNHRFSPPRQRNLERATELALAALAGQSEEQLRWLGAEPTNFRSPPGDRWRLLVLGQPLDFNFAAGPIATSDGQEVGPQWRILVLHYLGINSRPEPRQPHVTFADLATARSYAGVYHGRVIARLCATAGRNAQTLRGAAAGLAGRPVAVCSDRLDAVEEELTADRPDESGHYEPVSGDMAFDFDVFPRLTLRLIWHTPDEEFPPSATLLLPDNIEELFCPEDIVVLSECLVARLSGRPF